MKSVYWKPQKISRRVLMGVAILSIAGWSLVEYCPKSDQHRATKLAAAQRASELMQAVKTIRVERGVPIHTAFDPHGTGLVGCAMSSVTSRPANLRAKQTSVNPNFAVAIIDMLDRAEVQPGDTVAVGWSGSFPALNLAVCAALQSMQLQPVIVASASSSQYGANDPDFMWVDIEAALRKRDLIPFKSSAVSIGGGADRGVGMSEEAIAVIRAAIERNHYPLLNTTERLAAVEGRMQIFQRLAADRQIKAYINVGGGVASTGGELGKHLFRPGLNRHASYQALRVDSVMSRFAKQGLPIIHLVETRELAQAYAMPLAPTKSPEIGTGPVFSKQDPNRWLAAGVLVTLLFTLRSYLLTPLGFRIHDWLATRRLTRKPHLRVFAESMTDDAACESPGKPQLMV